MKKLFTDELGKNLEAVPGFNSIDELRDKNNKVKHGGDFGEPAFTAYDRLKEWVIPYLQRIALDIVP